MKRLLIGLAMSCACGTALANYGFEPVSSLAPDTVNAQALAIGDVSGDGRDDLIVLASSTHPLYLGLSPTVVAVRVDNHSQFLESQPFELMLELDARRGSVIGNGLPPGCSTFPSEAHDTVIRCWMASLPAGGDRTLQFPLAFSAEPGPNHLIARGSLQLNLPDLRNDNNVARKRIVIPPPKLRRAR